MKILGQNAYWVINKDLAKEVGLERALLLSDLIDKQEYFKQKNEVDNEGYFYNTSKNIEKDTTLSYKLQKKNLQILKEKGFIDTKLKGVPAKLYFKVIEEKIFSFVNSSFSKDLKLDNKTETNKIENTDKKINKDLENSNKRYFENDLLNDKFLEFIEYRKAMRKKMTEISISQSVKKINKWLEQYSLEEVIGFIDNSISNGYIGIFEDKKLKIKEKKIFKI